MWCKYLMSLSLQLHLIGENLDNHFGTFFSLFSQSMLTGSFNPREAFRENQLLVEEIPELHETVYVALVHLTHIKDEYFHIPVTELPSLLLPIGGAREAGSIFSTTEIRHRHVYYLHKAQFDRDILKNKTRTFALDYARYGLLSSIGSEFDGYSFVTKPLQELASHFLTLTKKGLLTTNRTNIFYDTGLEFIESKYQTNYYGHMLSKHIERVLQIMRLSTVLANINVAPEQFSTIMPQLPNGSDNIKIDDSISRLELLKKCELIPAGQNCKNKFHHEFTGEGICSTFNGISFSEKYHADSNTYLKVLFLSILNR